MDSEVPWLFQWLLVRHYGAPTALAAQMWRGYSARYPYQALNAGFHLRQGVDAVDAQDTGRLLMCLRRVQDVIQPQQLLAITMRLAPEGHGPRRRDVVALEHALLADVGPDGQWK